MGDRAQAARDLVEARRRGLWTAAEEVRAFDLWREAAPTTAVKDEAREEGWMKARAFWTEKAVDVGPGLAAHLTAHPFDVRAARAASGPSLPPTTTSFAARPPS